MKKTRRRKGKTTTIKQKLMYGAAALVLIAAIGGLSGEDANNQTDTVEQINQATAAPAIEETIAPTAVPTVAPTTAPTTAPTPAPTEIPVLKEGMKGDSVSAMQTRLIELGYLSGEADGDFGAKTSQAVKDFQICNRLEDDGVAGAETLTALYRFGATGQREVYVSSSGVYHTSEDCSGMKSSTKMKLSDAMRASYNKHDRCN